MNPPGRVRDRAPIVKDRYGGPSAISLPLFTLFPRLADRLPWLPLGHWPTPVTESRHFAAAHGLRAFYLKREDLSHPECGGNKIRGLEFALGEVQRRGAKTILTIGVIGSHHVCRTAWHARRLGLDTVAIVVEQPEAEYVRRNLSAGLAAGARYVPANRATLPPLFLGRLIESWIRQGRRPYCLAPGGTSALACLGHVNAALELKDQIAAGLLPDPDYLYVPLGSLGTAAGLLAGCKLAGLRTRLVGVVTAYRWYCTAGRWARLARRVLRLMRRYDPSVPTIEPSRSDVSVVSTALGEGYAVPTESSRRLAEEFRETEGLELDGTYTAKTLDGAMQFISAEQAADRTHLFWHTYHVMSPTTLVELRNVSRGLREHVQNQAAASTDQPEAPARE